MKFYLYKLAIALTLLALLAGMFYPAAGLVQAANPLQNDTPLSKARALLARMTPQERVGQLFLVTFNGTDLRETTAAYQLIADFHIGGLILSRENNNFDDSENLIRQIFDLTTGLQQIEIQAAQTNEADLAPQYIPLLIGLSHESDLYPSDQILSGLTPLPSLMAVGATWNVDLAYQTGQVLGSELSALGFNLYLGPSLDVTDGFYRMGNYDMGTRTFGGDPYWVSRLGQAYISGIHAGSTVTLSENNSARIAVIAKHFPGMGSSDRNPESEIPTVRKSLDQLKRVELAPFFTVTGNTPQSTALVDGLFLSHIRYQGFQGNIRDITTRPISFDQSALNDILKLEPLNQWRLDGGLLISDNLGSPALRRFFDPSGNNFDARQVARNALMAGNDLLYADGLISSSDIDPFTTLSRTIEFFTQTYRDDDAFAQRVDAAVERILTLKYSLYPDFNPDIVLPQEADLSQVGISSGITTQIAGRSATLISPDPAELANLLSRPPASNERILFITDDLPISQCATCENRPIIAVDALQSTILRLYGTQTGGPISRNLLQSFSFSDLSKIFLQQTEPPPIDEALRLASWIVVLIQRNDPDRPESLAFKRLLSERPDLVRNKRVVVFAVDAPYYLDATEISKLSAYYGLYARSSPFIDLAARILFQEHIPTGASPVSISGIGYDLVDVTQPNPQQIITLSLDTAEGVTAPDQTTAVPTPVPSFTIGDTLRLRTSPILDHNQNPVPDGTVVRFFFSVGDEPGLAQIIEAETADGIARVAYKIERGELLEITATSDPALNSNRLILDITANESAVITVIAPTSLPSPTLSPSVTPTPTPSPTPTLLPTPPPQTSMGDWVLTLALALGAAALVTWLALGLYAPRWALRMGLCTVIGGLIGFNYLALELPGSREILNRYESTAVIAASLLGAVVGAACGWLWYWITLRRQTPVTITPTPSRFTNPPGDPPLSTPNRAAQQPPEDQ